MEEEGAGSCWTDATVEDQNHAKRVAKAVAMRQEILSKNWRVAWSIRVCLLFLLSCIDAKEIQIQAMKATPQADKPLGPSCAKKL